MPKGEPWAGAPARCMRPLSEKEAANLTEIAGRYVELARKYRAAPA